MKKFLALFLALVMLSFSVFALASCSSKPELDFEDAKDALEENNYNVSYEDEPEEPFIEQMIYASKEKSNGDYMTIHIISFKDAKSAKLCYKMLQYENDAKIAELEAMIDSLELEIEMMRHILEEYDDDIFSEEIDEIEEEIDDYEDKLKDKMNQLEEIEDDYVIGRSGKTAWYGDKKAIEDTKD